MLTIRDCTTGKRHNSLLSARVAVRAFRSVTRRRGDSQYVITVNGREVFVRNGQVATSPIAPGYLPKCYGY